MIITWYGHSCFKVENSSVSVVFDPYRPGSVPGLSLPPLTADYCVCSHGHDDHFYPEGVRLSGKRPDAAMRQFPTFHDDSGGSKRGPNTMTMIELDGIRLLHMGDIGHSLGRLRCSEIGRVDVLMVPTGGFFTVDAAGARQLVEALDPTVTIPMHYSGDGFGYGQLSGVGEFVRLCGGAVYADTNVLELGSPLRKCTVVLRCPVKK